MECCSRLWSHLKTVFVFTDYLCHVCIRNDSLAGVAIADSEYPSRVCFTLLDKVRHSGNKYLPETAWLWVREVTTSSGRSPPPSWPLHLLHSCLTFPWILSILHIPDSPCPPSHTHLPNTAIPHRDHSHKVSSHQVVLSSAFILHTLHSVLC